MKKLMDRLYDNIDEAKAFALSFTNFVYFYDEYTPDDYLTTICEECGREVQCKDYLAPKSNCKKPTGLLCSINPGVSPELREELIRTFDITEDDFRPIRNKSGEIVYYQITPQNVLLPIHDVNGWSVMEECPKCGAKQYDGEWYDNEKDESYAFISQEALDNMHDLNILSELIYPRHGTEYIISRRVYDFLTEKYPRTHYFPLFLKPEDDKQTGAGGAE